MRIRSYYNENDPFAATWLRELIKQELIPAGDVDERDIREVQPGDVAGYTQAHFFAGIAGWSEALRLAGWPADRAVWTGSCPCQPFSQAGARRGFDDERHLWPEFKRLIGECRPAIVFGEQVARAADWQRLVRGDLEAMDYAVGAIPIEAACVGAPHLRDRFWFTAHAVGGELRDQPGRRGWPSRQGSRLPGDHGEDRPLADPSSARRSGGLRKDGSKQDGPQPGDGSPAGGAPHVGHAGHAGLPVPEREELRGEGRGQEGRAAAQSGWWAAEPDVGRVAHGVSARVGKLRALGNAIVPQVAAQFIVAAAP